MITLPKNATEYNGHNYYISNRFYYDNYVHYICPNEDLYKVCLKTDIVSRLPCKDAAELVGEYYYNPEHYICPNGDLYKYNSETNAFTKYPCTDINQYHTIKANHLLKNGDIVPMRQIEVVRSYDEDHVLARALVMYYFDSMEEHIVNLRTKVGDEAKGIHPENLHFVKDKKSAKRRALDAWRVSN